jgi:nitrogen fixation-related uncharacterized protein
MGPTHRIFLSPGSILMAIIVMAVFFWGCASRPAVTGRWQDVQGPATVRFEAGGVFHGMDNEGMAVSGTYRLKGADGILFQVDHGDNRIEVVEARITLQEDRMVLIFPGEKEVQAYRRQP